MTSQPERSPAPSEGPSRSDRDLRETLLLALLADNGDERRTRRDPEHAYTAASIASFGAVAWGVAALGTVGSGVARWLPAVVAAVGTLVLAAAVIAKIVREHWAYKDLRRSQVQLFSLLNEPTNASGTPCLGQHEVPGVFKNAVAGRGYAWSILVVAVAGIGTIAFCLSVAATPHSPTTVPSGALRNGEAGSSAIEHAAPTQTLEPANLAVNPPTACGVRGLLPTRFGGLLGEISQSHGQEGIEEADRAIQTIDGRSNEPGSRTHESQLERR